MQANITLKNLDSFKQAMLGASERVQKAMYQEMNDTAISTASKTKVLINQQPAAGGKIGRIVTGRYINSFHVENKNTRAYSYSNNEGESFNGTFQSERPDSDTILVGSNVVYAPILEYTDQTFERAWDEETKALEVRWKKILRG